MEVGNVVKLKSGGMEMTVTRIQENGKVNCSFWGSSDSGFGLWGNTSSTSFETLSLDPACLIVVKQPAEELGKSENIAQHMKDIIP